MKSCVILTPLWKYDLYDYELLSLKRILDLYNNVWNKKYDIVFLIPNKFNIDELFDKYNLSIINYRYLIYSQYFFSSSLTYNKIMLSKEFYETYINEYKYMLIYQLDAYIFNYTLLDYFLNQNYEYIGSYERIIDESLLSYITFTTNNFNVKNKNKLFHMNGGLSLRNIEYCYNIINNNLDFVQKIYASDEHLLEEDAFYSTYISTPVNVLDSIKFGYSHLFFITAYAINNYEYPFGCHSICKDIRLMNFIRKFNKENNLIYE